MHGCWREILPRQVWSVQDHKHVCWRELVMTKTLVCWKGLAMPETLVLSAENLHLQSAGRGQLPKFINKT